MTITTVTKQMSAKRRVIIFLISLLPINLYNNITYRRITQYVRINKEKYIKKMTNTVFYIIDFDMLEKSQVAQIFIQNDLVIK